MVQMVFDTTSTAIVAHSHQPRGCYPYLSRCSYHSPIALVCTNTATFDHSTQNHSSRQRKMQCFWPFFIQAESSIHATAVTCTKELILILALTTGILHCPTADAKTQQVQVCLTSFYHKNQKHTSRVRRRKSTRALSPEIKKHEKE